MKRGANRVRLREEGNVPVPLREDLRVGAFELPHRDLQFPRQAGEVTTLDHSRVGRVFSADHEDLRLPDAQLLDRPAAIVERVAHEAPEDNVNSIRGASHG